MTPAHLLIYVGKLPPMNALYPSPWRRKRLKEAALKQFGVWPWAETRRAHVIITRVLGKGERVMDSDNMIFACKGARDALRNSWTSSRGRWHLGGNYLVDDSPRWSTFTYAQDPTRRLIGPRLEVLIHYLEDI
jgi:hypothetical protein